MFRLSSIVRKSLAPAVALVCLAAIPGCGSKVTPENYAKIKPGQTEAEVIEILGKPTSTETQDTPGGKGSKEVWTDGNKTIMVGIFDGKVMLADKSGF